MPLADPPSPGDATAPTGATGRPPRVGRGGGESQDHDEAHGRRWLERLRSGADPTETVKQLLLEAGAIDPGELLAVEPLAHEDQVIGQHPGGLRALEAIKEEDFDLVLMDIHMRKVSGIEALAEIKSYNPRIPVIIMTALASVEYAAEAQKKGASDFLTKPFDPDGLRKPLSRALDNLSLKVQL